MTCSSPRRTFFLQSPCIFISGQCIICPIQRRDIIKEHWTRSTVSTKEADHIWLKSDVIMNFKQRWIQLWRHKIHQSRLITLIPKSTFRKQRETIDILKNIFAWSITDFSLTGCHMKRLSNWDSNWLGMRICFRQSMGFQSITAVYDHLTRKCGLWKTSKNSFR